MSPELTRQRLASALERAGNTATVDDVLMGIDRGEFQIWPGEDSVIVTQVQDLPRKRLLCLYLAAGNLEELHRMLPGVLTWGMTQGCDRAFLVGREGWQRSFLVQEAWRPTSVVLEKELVHEGR